jgi:glucosamine--fructose-6-phosphate aminotransferase (isomerizing)
MDRSWALDWSAALPQLQPSENLYVVGRGLGLGAAQEIALKCKETCAIHAEAFSSAELRHGPYTLLRKGFPTLLLAQRDGTRPGIEALAIELARRGVAVLLAGGNAAGSILLPAIETSAELAPILLVQSAYRMIASLSVTRGLDPDHPPHLRKITETV